METTGEDRTERASTLRDAVETDPDSVDVDDAVDLLVRGDRETRRIAFDVYDELATVRPDTADAAGARLEAHLSNDVGDVRQRAAKTACVLVERRPGALERGVPELRTLGGDPGEPGREPAVLALSKLALERPAAAVPAVAPLLGICHSPVVAPDDPAAEDGIADARSAGRSAVGPERERRDEVRVHAIAGLTRIAAEEPSAMREFVPDVADLLEDDHHILRAGACEVLEPVGAAFPGDVESSLPELATRAATDPKHPVPWRAADALLAIGDGRPERVGEAVARVAGELGTFLESRDANRRSVGAALLTNAARVRWDAVEPAVPALRDLLADDDPSVRAEAAHAFGFAGDSADDADVSTVLGELAESDPDPDVRARAERSLERLGRPEDGDE